MASDKVVQKISVEKVSSLLAQISRKCQFCIGGVAKLPCLPGLLVDRVGLISLPLLPNQADQLQQAGSQAPFGMGTQTLVDKSVRDTIQLDPSMFSFTSPLWEEAVQNLVKSVCVGLGVSEQHVQHKIYKLLLYGKGGHFKSHKDTEKFEGMFATLVVQFPSVFQGGCLVVRHGGVTKHFPMGADDNTSASAFHYAAHFADCDHEILEVTDGYRLAAVYSLCWRGDSPLPSMPDSALSESLANELRLLGDACVGVFLTHHYTRPSLANLGLRALKGADRALTAALLAASDAARGVDPADALVLHVARVVRESGSDGPLNPRVDLNTVFCADGGMRDHQTASDPVGAESFLDKWTVFAAAEAADDSEDHMEAEEGGEDEEDGHWVYVRPTGYLGNEGDPEGRLYERYMLTMHRAGAAAPEEQSEVYEETLFG